jgi:hypothetical protein
MKTEVSGTNIPPIDQNVLKSLAEVWVRLYDQRYDGAAYIAQMDAVKAESELYIRVTDCLTHLLTITRVVSSK